MESTTQTYPLSGVSFEAVQVLRPHPKIRPVSAPYGQIGLRDSTASAWWSRSSEATMVDTSTSPHLYISRQQYAVASGQVLGSLSRPDTDVSRRSLEPEAQLSCPLSQKRMLRRAKTVFKKSLCHSDKGNMTELGSPDSLRSGVYAAAAVPILLLQDAESEEENEELEESEESTTFISDEPPQIPPLQRISKFKPILKISIPGNKISSSVFAEHHSIESETDDESLMVVLPRLQDSDKAGETLSNHVTDARDDDDVFSTPDGMSHICRPVIQLETKVYIPMGAYHAYKTPSGPSSMNSSTATPPRLRHTALHSSPDQSLRSRYSASEPPSVMEQTIRCTPSLENVLSVDDLEVFEEDAVAVVAPLLCGVEPNIVDVQVPGIVEVPGRRKVTVSGRHDSYDELMLPAPVDCNITLRMQLPMLPISPTVAQLMPAPLRYASPDATVPALSFQLPLHIVEAIAFSAAWGDVECQALSSDLYKQVSRAQGPTVGLQRVIQEQCLLRKSHLVQELDSLVRREHLPENLFETVRSQLFPTTTTNLMENRDFAAYICCAVDTLHLTEGKAEEILQLAIGHEGFAQMSPEEEESLGRQAFDLGGFVYDGSIDDGLYRRLGSTSSTIGTYEPAGPQQRVGRRSPFFTKVVQVCRLSFRKRPS
jgi:hypothetical protein